MKKNTSVHDDNSSKILINNNQQIKYLSKYNIF